jgi:fructose-1-phosphate kinase PfkB-like protein
VIVVAGFNPAWDVIVQARSWLPGSVERAERQQVVPGGKAVNVARNCGRMGVPTRLVVLADAQLAEAMGQALAAHVDLRLVASRTRSRTDVCLTTGDGVTTVVNGPPPSVASAEIEAALELLETSIDAGDVVVLAGRQLPGSVAPLLGLVSRRGGRLVVDVSGPDLPTCLDASPSIAKVNAAELSALSPDAAVSDARWAGRSLAPQPAELIVTDGERGLRAWLADGRIVDVRPPHAREINAFGAGDAMTAGIVAALDAGRPTIDGLVRGTAWAAAAVECFGPEFDPDRARALESRVEIEWVEAPTPEPATPAARD